MTHRKRITTLDRMDEILQRLRRQPCGLAESHHDDYCEFLDWVVWMERDFEELLTSLESSRPQSPAIESFGDDQAARRQ